MTFHRHRRLRASGLGSVAGHPKSLVVELLQQLRGRDQLLIQAGDALPLVVASYPRGSYAFATSLQSALCSTFRTIDEEDREVYRDVLEKTPSLVVVILRARNYCGCLGHHHPRGTQSRLARRLAADTGLVVGEIDLAVEAIRSWEPLPLSGLAMAAGVEVSVGRSLAELEYYRFHTALLAVFLHELEHLSFPERSEARIRRRSDEFHRAAIRGLVGREFGASFGI